MSPIFWTHRKKFRSPKERNITHQLNRSLLEIKLRLDDTELNTAVQCDSFHSFRHAQDSLSWHDKKKKEKNSRTSNLL